MPSTIAQTPANLKVFYVNHLLSGGDLLPHSPENLKEVVGILKSYGVVLEAYWKNLVYIADHQFLVLFPFFKYFDGEFSLEKLLRHWNHDRINFEYAEYCMRVMLWHSTGPLNTYLDNQEFCDLAEQAIQAKLKSNPLMQVVHKLFPEFLPEQVRQSVYYSALGQFWRVMSDMFLQLSDRYDDGKIQAIPDVVAFIQASLVAAAGNPIVYSVEIAGKTYDILPKAAGFTFLMDVAVPYVEAVFFRGTPFLGTVSYNAQAQQIPFTLEQFAYGALYADPLPIGGGGIPPTLLMQDMRHYLPDYLINIYRSRSRGEVDLRVKICQSFQKSMFCVTTAAIKGLMPFPLDTTEPDQQKANHKFVSGWIERLLTSCLNSVN